MPSVGGLVVHSVLSQELSNTPPGPLKKRKRPPSLTPAATEKKGRGHGGLPARGTKREPSHRAQHFSEVCPTEEDGHQCEGNKSADDDGNQQVGPLPPAAPPLGEGTGLEGPMG